MVSINQLLFDAGVRHAFFLERLKAGEARQITKLLVDDVWPDLLGQLTKRLERMSITGKDRGVKTTARLRDMMAALDGIVANGIDEAHTLLARHLAEIAVAEARFQVKTLARAMPSELEWAVATPNLRMVQGIVRSRPLGGHQLGEWFNGLKKATQSRIRQELNTGLAQGQTISQLVARVREVSGISKRGAELVARTTTTAVSNDARDITFQENSDLVKEWQFVATLDLRTTVQCWDLDGTRWALGEGPKPPIHPNCRSTSVPVVGTWRQLGLSGLAPETRASMDGPVDGRITAHEWLKGRSAAEQDELLGRVRGLLFRQGRLQQGDFTTSSYSPISVEDLLRREGLDS